MTGVLSMKDQLRRFAAVTAILWFAFGVGGPAEAGPILTTPMGLSPGEQFRFVFVTEGTEGETVGSNTSIDFYNNFVNTQAGGATYNGSTIQWTAIASTEATSAINNILGTQQAPVYLPDGTEVTSSTDAFGLWSGNLKNPINEFINGQMTVGVLLWTGTNTDGTASPGNSLGDPTANFGDSLDTNKGWVDTTSLTTSLLLPMYGISQVLIVPQSVVPEPSSLWMAGIAISAGLAYGWYRPRRDQRWQKPVGPPDATE